MKLLYNNNNSFSIKGFWSLSFKESKKEVAGILYYSEEKISLELFDSLEEIDITSNKKIRIEGIAKNNSYLTLFDCLRVSSSNSSITLVEYRVGKFTLGDKYIDSLDQPLFSKANLCTSNMKEWFSFNLLKYEKTNNITSLTFNKEEANHNLKSFSITSESTVIKEAYKFHTQQRIQNETSFEVDYFFEIIPEEPVSLNTIFSLSRKIVSLFILLQGQYENITFLELYFSDKDALSNNPYPKIRYYFTPLRKSDNLRRSFTNYRFNYQEIRNQLPVLLTLFFEKYPLLEEIIQTYIGDIERTPFVQTIFLNKVRCLEVYSRITAVPPNDNVAIEQARVSLNNYLESNFSDNPEVLRYFQTKVNYKNEASLNSRLSKTLKLLTPTIKNNIIKKIDKDMKKSISSFTCYLVDTRNYLTHGETNKEKYSCLITDSYQLFLMNKKLTLIIEYFILSELGMDTTVISNALLKHTQYGYLFPPASDDYSFVQPNE